MDIRPTRKNEYKAVLIKKSNLFKSYAENSGGYYHPAWIPSYPELISIGNNVTIAADVRFYEHDLICRMINNDVTYTGKKMNYFPGEITVGDNTVICARSIILYNVHIGKNSIVAAGSVVTKDVPDYAIVGGNPARIIGDSRKLVKKRMGL